MISLKSIVCSVPLVHVMIKVWALPAWTSPGMFGWFISTLPFGAEEGRWDCRHGLTGVFGQELGSLVA
jgi:hypothetical protein